MSFSSTREVLTLFERLDGVRPIRHPIFDRVATHYLVATLAEELDDPELLAKATGERLAALQTLSYRVRVEMGNLRNWERQDECNRQLREARERELQQRLAEKRARTLPLQWQETPEPEEQKPSLWDWSAFIIVSWLGTLFLALLFWARFSVPVWCWWALFFLTAQLVRYIKPRTKRTVVSPPEAPVPAPEPEWPPEAQRLKTQLERNLQLAERSAEPLWQYEARRALEEWLPATVSLWQERERPFDDPEFRDALALVQRSATKHARDLASEAWQTHATFLKERAEEKL